MHMPRVCCHSGRLTNPVWAVYVHICVPMHGVLTPHGACESSSHPTADRDPVCHCIVLARPDLALLR